MLSKIEFESHLGFDIWLPVWDDFRTLVFDPPAQIRWQFEMIGGFLGVAVSFQSQSNSMNPSTERCASRRMARSRGSLIDRPG